MSEPEGTCAGALGGQVALVTGAGRGIGAATAHRLATDGASVAVVDLHEDDTADTVARIRDDGGTAIGIGCDVAASDQVEAAVERAVADLGGLHILVNNAGIARDNLLFRMSDEDWDAVIAVHLRGAFLFSRVPPATPATCGGKATSHPGGRRCGAAT